MQILRSTKDNRKIAVDSGLPCISVFKNYENPEFKNRSRAQIAILPEYSMAALDAALNELADSGDYESTSNSTYRKEKRNEAHFFFADFLTIDVDGTRALHKVIKKLDRMHVEYLIRRSRNHQIPKQVPGRPEGTFRKAARFHIWLKPVKRIKTLAEYRATMRFLLTVFSFADAKCIDGARIFFNAKGRRLAMRAKGKGIQVAIPTQEDKDNQLRKALKGIDPSLLVGKNKLENLAHGVLIPGFERFHILAKNVDVKEGFRLVSTRFVLDDVKNGHDTEWFPGTKPDFEFVWVHRSTRNGEYQLPVRDKFTGMETRSQGFVILTVLGKKIRQRDFKALGGLVIKIDGGWRVYFAYDCSNPLRLGNAIKAHMMNHPDFINYKIDWSEALNPFAALRINPAEIMLLKAKRKPCKNFYIKSAEQIGLVSSTDYERERKDFNEKSKKADSRLLQNAKAGVARPLIVDEMAKNYWRGAFPREMFDTNVASLPGERKECKTTKNKSAVFIAKAMAGHPTLRAVIDSGIYNNLPVIFNVQSLARAASKVAGHTITVDSVYPFLEALETNGMLVLHENAVKGVHSKAFILGAPYVKVLVSLKAVHNPWKAQVAKVAKVEFAPTAGRLSDWLFANENFILSFNSPEAASKYMVDTYNAFMLAKGDRVGHVEAFYRSKLAKRNGNFNMAKSNFKQSAA